MHDAISAWFGGIGLPFDLLEVQHLPLYEMVEQLIALLPAPCKDDAGYLQAFRDNVLEFSTRQSHWMPSCIGGKRKPTA